MNPPLAFQNTRGRVNLVVVVLCFVVVGLGAWVLKLRNAAAESETRIAAPKASPAAPESRKADAVVQTPAEAPPGPAPAAADPEQPANPMAAMAEMMKSPAMQEMIRSQQRRMVEMQYAEILTRLNLSADQRNRLLGILLDAQSRQTDLGMQAMGGIRSEAERNELSNRMTQSVEDLEANVKTFFNTEFPDDPAMLTAFQEYQDTAAERAQVDMVREALGQSNQPLSADQAAALVRIMREERRTQSGGMSQAEEMKSQMEATQSAEGAQRLLNQFEESSRRVVDRAATVLSPMQLAALRESQSNQLQMMKMGVEMSRQIMGGGAAK